MDGKVQMVECDDGAGEPFGEAGLGDVRRARRLVKWGVQMAGNSSGTIPQQTQRWADIKAAYRLFAQEAVTHEAVCTPYGQRTREQAGGLSVVLMIQDTTELDFTYHTTSPSADLLPGGARRGRRPAWRGRRVGVDSAHQPDHRDFRAGRLCE